MWAFFRSERSEQAQKPVFYRSLCCFFFNYYFWNTGLQKPLSAWSLMNSYGSLEDNAEGDVGCGGVTHEVSESSKDVINNWTMDHLCYILAKNCGRW